MADTVAGNPFMSLAIIVVLLIVVVGLYTYYHGILCLGPYVSTGAAASRSSRARGKAPEIDDAAKGDPETERLIDSINGA